MVLDTSAPELCAWRLHSHSQSIGIAGTALHNLTRVVVVALTVTLTVIPVFPQEML